MHVRTDLTEALLALIPEDGSRVSNEQLRAALAEEADKPFSNEEFEAAKDHVVATGAAEKTHGPAGCQVLTDVYLCVHSPFLDQEDDALMVTDTSAEC